MADVSTSPFTFRDFIQLIFPTMVALAMFVPFDGALAGKLSVTGLVFAAIVLGYLMSSLVTAIANWVTARIPFFGRRLDERKRQSAWLTDNWDLAALHSYLTKDENDFIDLLSSLWIFYRITAFYLLAYATVNVVRVALAVHHRPGWLAAARPGGWTTAWEVARTLDTPMLGNWSLPTLVAIGVSLPLMGLALRDCLQEYERVFLEGGLYDQYAAKYQRKERTIARRVWGQVLDGGRPLGDATVRVLRYGAEIVRASSDQSGRFFFNRPPDELEGYLVEATSGDRSASCTVRADNPRMTLVLEHDAARRTEPA